MLNTLMAFLISIINFLYVYSSLKWMVSKFTLKSDEVSPPSGVAWLIGLYVACFGLANQNYQSESANAVIFKNLSVSSVFPNSGGVINSISTKECRLVAQDYRTLKKVPVEPKLFQPVTIYQSLFGEYVAPLNLSIPTIMNARYLANDVFWYSNKEGYEGILNEPIVRSIKSKSLAKTGRDISRASARELYKKCYNPIFIRPVFETDYDLKDACIYEAIIRGCEFIKRKNGAEQ